MTELDWVISGGTIVTPVGEFIGDIGTIGGVIAAITSPGVLSGRQRMDASGLLVLPGGIDPHVHCNWPIGGTGDQPATVTGGPGVVSRAALWGGTTTLLDFATVVPGGDLGGACISKEQEWQGQSFCDYSFHVMLRGHLTREQIAEVPDVVAKGYTSFKVFTTNVRPGLGESRLVPVGDLYNLMCAAAARGAIIALHAEDDDLVMHNYRELLAEGRTALIHMPAVHSDISEDLAFNRVLRLARYVPDVALYFMHVSAGAGVQALEQARHEGMCVAGETWPQYSLVDSNVYSTPQGVRLHNYPSIKGRNDVEEIWRGVRTGVVESFATDELCTSEATKIQGTRIDDATGGNSAVELRMALIFDEMVNTRQFSVSEFANAVSTNAARTFGMYPKKGLLAPGSDADICLLDPTSERIVDHTSLHETDYSPWEGRRLRGWPVATMLRGELVVGDGEFIPSSPNGTRVKRQPRKGASDD